RRHRGHFPEISGGNISGSHNPAVHWSAPLLLTPELFMSRIALFGGSFDPVHLGHLMVAQAAREELSLDRLFFIPAGQSPFKPVAQPAPGPERLRLLRLALAGKHWCEVDDREIRRGGISYTIDTAREYVAVFPDSSRFYLIGADNVAQLEKWRDSAELARLLHFAAIPRPGLPQTAFPPSFRGRFLQGCPFDVSSSQIRARVKSGLPVDHLVPPAVAEAIRNNRLYL
ncbi:MAG TPA: nicotinate-nucleotide adenylyltransferase, partial [Verrucomicrobiae bacterium]|nr:nicotinate-nucleotide adenylyltransferase [Verrucomicrobiae bacterium]